jgi:hypothetical protein
MKSAEHEIIELALKKASPAHQKVGWVKIFNKVLVPVQKVFSFKAKAFSFCLFYCTLHRHSERNEESSYFSPGSFDFVLRTSLRMTAWKQPLFTF